MWNNTDNDNSPVLRTTKGGYPHITIAYTGKLLSSDDLTEFGMAIFSILSLNRVTLERAHVNSFTTGRGYERHDVLVSLAEGDAACIEKMRDHVRTKCENADKFSMQPAHVTHGIYDTLEEAEAAAKALNDKNLPYEVQITGFTID